MSAEERTTDDARPFGGPVTSAILAAKTCCTALEELYQDNAGPIDPALARTRLAAALPHGAVYPKIFHCAARVYFALGERDRVVEMVAAGERNDGSIWLIRDDMALAPMWQHPGYAGLFAHLDPPLFAGLKAALAAGPEVVRRLKLGISPWDGLRALVNLEQIDVWGDEDALEVLAELPRLARLTFRGHLHRPLPTAFLTRLVQVPTLEELTFEVDGVAVRPGQVRALRADFARQDRSPQERLLHVALLFDTGDATAERAGVRDLVAALDAGVPAVRSAAQRVLADRLTVPEGGLRRGDGVLLAGKINADRAALADRLAALGATLDRRPGPATRLAVVGEQHRGRALAHLDAGIPLILESHLRDVLDAAVPQPLSGTAGAGQDLLDGAVPEPLPGAGHDPAARLRALLTSPDQADIKAAVDLARKDGLQAGLLEELIVVWKDTRLGRPVRGGAQKLLAEHAPAALNAALAGAFARTNVFRETADSWDVMSAVHDLVEECPGTIDGVRLLTLLIARRDAGPFGRRLDVRGGWMTFTHLPSYVLELTGLDHLRVEQAGLVELPGDIGRLAGLSILDLGNNLLTTLPAGLAELRDLRKLDLSNNHFVRVPEVVFELSGLRQLSLAVSNWSEPWPAYLTELPDLFHELTGLAHLDLSHQHLVTLPESMGAMSNLTSLNLRGTRLRRLPSWLADVPKLGHLYLEGAAVDDDRANRDVIARLRAARVDVRTDLPDA
ncbi:leucine-rich repeat domain-containing protein [Actinoplanes regularis]|uniref:Leucine rich repeat-containing protein n=1 Tax=Actinoplanes regularis TaxID=52697 RepID=A0A239DP25_9ACTN|nr:leucine-rich repeat domain-containing protein [Actinoplanes regularis]SNS33831.1 Leucine rich repeat-containing protein [Actinoplanes regularis]